MVDDFVPIPLADFHPFGRTVLQAKGQSGRFLPLNKDLPDGMSGSQQKQRLFLAGGLVTVRSG